MSDISITIEADSDCSGQVNDARAAYLDGEISEEELSERVEAAIADGAGISDSDDWLPEPSLKRTASGLLHAPVMALTYGIYRLKGGCDATVSLRQNVVAWVDEDPNPDDHPAESAGSTQTLLGFYPTFLYMLSSLALLISVPKPLEASMVTPTIAAMVYGSFAFMLLAIATIFAEKPTVRCTDRGIGTHTVRP